MYQRNIMRTEPSEFLRAVPLVIFILGMLATPVAAFERYTAHGGPVRDLTLSPDGRTLVSASFDYSAVVWQAPDIIEKTVLYAHEAAVNTARFSPNGEILATAGDDGRIYIWRKEVLENEDPEPIILSGHKGKVVNLSFSSDGNTLASASWDGSIGIWPLGEGIEKAEAQSRFILGHEGAVNAVQFAPDNTHLYSAGQDGEVRYWRLSNNEYLRSVVYNGWSVSVVKVDELNDFVAYGSSDGTMNIDRLSDGSEVMRLGDERVPVLAIYHSPRYSLIAFGNAKGRVVVINTKDWSIVRDFNAANGPIWSLVIMPDGQSIVVAGLDDFITRWELFEFPPEFLERPGPARRFQPIAEISNGEKQFARKCSVCHTLSPDGKRRAGPTLFGVFGRMAGTLEGYPYSKALIDSDIVWDEFTIEKLFAEGPDIVTPGTKMPIQRMRNQQDLIDLVAFLKTATK
jgi:cytochrome c